MRKKQYVWVVEVWNDTYREPRWKPTVGCALTKDQARFEKAEWQERNPNDKFRVRKYEVAQ